LRRGSEVDAGQQRGDRGPGARVASPHVFGPAAGHQVTYGAGQPVLLSEVADPQIAGAGDPAAVGLLRPRQERQQRGLADPVAPTSADRLIPPPETGRLLGVSRWTVKRLADEGYLEPVHVLGAVRYRQSDIQLLIRFGTRRRPPKGRVA
jgi:hypothetical protein